MKVFSLEGVIFGDENVGKKSLLNKLGRRKV
jgi:tRNA U34 5-carboxymethylaminomethyl modifying GTPase MnmE/TrmE